MVVYTYTGMGADGTYAYYCGVPIRDLSQADYDALTTDQQAQVASGVIYTHA